jgi:hypothetical protein
MLKSAANIAILLADYITEIVTQLKMLEPKSHSILLNPFEYDIVDFRFFVDQDDHGQSFIDMTLKKDADTVTLRFWRPIKLKIEEGFPIGTSGMVFYDVSDNGLEDIGVEVADFECLSGAVTFFAKSVERVS